MSQNLDQSSEQFSSRSRSGSVTDPQTGASRRAALSQITAGFRSGQDREFIDEPRNNSAGGGDHRETQSFSNVSSPKDQSSTLQPILNNFDMDTSGWIQLVFD